MPLTREDGEAIARCFTTDAVVKDEGHTYAGVAEIRRWKEATSSKFTYTRYPFALDRNDGQIIVTSRLTGNFPEPDRSALLLRPRRRQDRGAGDHPVSFDLELVGRRALVTGGTRGVGAAVVDGLRAAGVQVVATARTVPATSPDGVHHVAADLTTADGCAMAAQVTLDRLGGIDILVNVLGGSSAPPGGFAVLDDAEWAKDWT